MIISEAPFSLVLVFIGGLIQTAEGISSAFGCPLTNLSGCFSKACLSVSVLAIKVFTAKP